MPGQTHDEAFEAFAEPVRAAISFIDPMVELTKVWLDHHEVWRLATKAGEPISVDRGGRDPYFLVLTIDVYAVPNTQGPLPWRMKTVRYVHELNLSHRGRRANRIFAWHWHPDSTESPVEAPHIHTSKNAIHAKAHVSSGRISIEEVVLFLIDEVDAEASDGARDALCESIDKYEKYRNWNSARGAKREHIPRHERLGAAQND